MPFSIGRWSYTSSHASFTTSVGTLVTPLENGTSESVKRRDYSQSDQTDCMGSSDRRGTREKRRHLSGN